MGKSVQRDRALQAAKNADTPQGVIDALMKYGTPYQKQVAKGLQKQLHEMSAQVIADLKQQEQSQEFAKKIMAP